VLQESTVTKELLHVLTVPLGTRAMLVHHHALKIYARLDLLALLEN
jgi:hypothetical protein